IFVLCHRKLSSEFFSRGGEIVHFNSSSQIGIEKLIFKMDQLDEQTMQMAEEQITLERKKLPSLNLLPEEERKRIVQRVIILTTPMLIHEDNNLRIRGRGREIISDFSKTIGMATMIDVMRPDIGDMDEYVRNGAAICFSIVASTLGIPAILPLLREICRNMNSWQARHTGIMIVHQIAILMRSTALLVGSGAIQPHLVSLMEIIEPRLKDETKKVRTITTLAMDVLTEADAGSKEVYAQVSLIPENHIDG
ncbi:hypothetical protein H5410_020222, partial [Solanum commersonii]